MEYNEQWQIEYNPEEVKKPEMRVYNIPWHFWFSARGKGLITFFPLDKIPV